MKDLLLLQPYIRNYKFRFLAGFIFVTISNLCSTYMPRFVGKSVNLIESGNFSMDAVGYLVIIIILLTAGSGLFMYLTRRAIIDASRLIEYDLRNDYFGAVQAQSPRFFQENPTGSLMALATNDIPAAREFLGPAIMYAANTITTFSFALYFMLSLNAGITIVSIFPLPVIAFLTYKIGKRIHTSFKKVQEQFSTLTTFAQESFSGIRIIRAYIRSDYESRRFANESQDYLQKNMKLARIQSATMPLLMVLVGLSQISALGFGGYQVIHGNAKLGDLAQFFIYINQLIWPIAAIGWITNLVQRAAASSARLAKIIHSVPEIIDTFDTNADITEINGRIEFVEVKFGYNDLQNDTLSGLNLVIAEGESLGIVGTVGSGKSTLVHLVPRFYDVTGGSIMIDGHEIREIPVDTLRKSIGYVPQEPFLFSMSIFENVKFGKPDATQGEVTEACRMAQLDTEIQSFPQKYDTILGERGITLSGGQKQRLAIARAIIKNPSVLILDDALSAVDTNTEDKLLRELRKIMSGRTSLLISHRISTVMRCDKIITIDKGKIIESGTHEELIAKNGKYAEMYSRQQLEEEIEKL